MTGAGTSVASCTRAALRAGWERPLANVTMQEVADRAGLSITSVYARFDGKNALFLAVVEPGGER